MLNPGAVHKFIRVTHERYYERLGQYFGSTVKAMFTDEPSILGRRHRKGLQPWTRGFLAELLAGGMRETDLPHLWLDHAASAAIRQQFRKAVQSRLSAAYYKPLSDWCASHKIALTGHPAGSEDIGMLEHFQIPGQDVVWRWVAPEDGKALEGRHSTMAKCSSDAARHRGRRRNLNEFLGVCGKAGGWDLTADDMKWYMDWLFVRGVNLLCPHAFYYSVDGPLRFGERPPDVGPNNIWWPHYKRFADYMKRMSWLMTDSRNVTPIAVLCQGDALPWKPVKLLYENQLEFNYLEESLLCSSCSLDQGQLRIAKQSYSVLLMENEKEWEDETQLAIRRFESAGGTVLRIEESALADLVQRLDAAVPRDATLRPGCPDIRVSHVVKGGEHFYLFVNEGETVYEGHVTLRMTGKVEKWEAWTGRIVPTVSNEVSEGIRFALSLERRESVICRIASDLHPSNEGESRAAVSRIVGILTEGWRIEAPGFPVAPSGLGPWPMDAGMNHFTGTAVYRNTFTLTELKTGSEVFVDLGEVHELAEVRVNGQLAGAALWRPYVLNITAYAGSGENELHIAVTNSLANRYDGAGLPAGLIGPVRITVKQ